ncbi:MAG TPA: zinc finger Ran-binding domain-containing protein [Pyrinomonadaceae bacterium]|nr:zinc finger Ran-binding domain-containing protein [Pyrinomonadaceae bacterium]
MNSSWKCVTCGLVNFAADARCKRCGTEVVDSAVPAPTPSSGIVLEDGYVMPPPPSGGVWRDKSTLVMTKEATLPDRCVKCDAPANGLRLKKNLSWHHPILYLLVFGAALLYIIIAAVLSKRATVYLGLCAAHFQRRRKQLVAAWLLLLLGIIIPVAAIAYDYPILALLGVVLFITAVVWLIVASRVVSVKKIDDRLVWLNGFNRDYLSQLPPWQT